MLVTWSKRRHVEAGLLGQGKRLFKDALRHEDLAVRDCIRNEWHGKEVPFSTGPLSKLVNDFKQVCGRGPRERTHHRDKLHARFGQTGEVIRNRSHRSPPPYPNYATVVGLEPFTQQFRSDNGDRSTCNRTFGFESCPRRESLSSRGSVRGYRWRTAAKCK